MEFLKLVPSIADSSLIFQTFAAGDYIGRHTRFLLHIHLKHSDFNDIQ
jgi:hypothetical protein